MATINGVEVIGDKTAHDFDLLDKDDGINLANGVERNREAAEDNHADIVLHRTDTDVHVTPEWKNSLVKKETLGLYWTAAQTADIINEISIAGGAKLVKVDELPETGKEQTIYLVPKTDPKQGDIFDEYVWIDGKFEFIGTTKVDLSNYATKTELNAKQDALSAQQIQNIADVTNKANDADVVHIKGTDDIIDSKTFISLYTQSSGPSLWMKNTSFTMGSAPATNRYSGIWVQDNAGTDTAYIVHQANKNNSQNLKFSVSNTDGTTVYQNALTFQGRLDGTFNFYSDNPANLGTSTNKWTDVNTVLLNGKTPDLIEEQGSAYIRYTNGFQICWGAFQGITTSQKTISLPKSFSTDPAVFVNCRDGIYVTLKNFDNSSFTVISTTSSSTAWFAWQAIGNWK